ncbi:hypothetical protein [[Clostridium] symbiosum]|uniref:hypothetical protein n=1 Tax=Clostridium symbiosum TaxID=1512 RepID=UPI0034A59557
MGLFLCFKKKERREKNADCLSLDELIEIAGYGFEWIIENGHITAALMLEEGN